MKRFLGVAAVAGLVGFAVPAHAVPTIELFDGFTTLTCADGDACDTVALAGVVSFSPVGGIGDWLVNVTTGLTKPLLGSLTEPYMDLNSVNVSFGAGLTTLRIRFSEVGFGPMSVGMVASIGGTLSGTLDYNTYWDGSNALFGTANLLTELSFGASPFSGTDTNGTPIPGSPFSLTQEVLITHGAGPETTSFDAELQAVPEPATLLLLGSGLTGLALRRRRKV